ncbi:helix-turn-helix domain-containing protein [Nocardia goodfellowii]|uniref:AraC-like DNA-binding protein n=1 Tax=Nocardia goodfellowii TaxID=882446 RepID=A0ABS4QH14_9NOCA|nr:helix-turn-helix domain-containing protein [Nocardia goodfellowii]MBP2190995.1 AraC-like DNA-binding protein [Nocardia goodfellowii]
MEKALVTDGVSARTATALLRPGILAFGGAIAPSDLHAHHAVQVLTASTPITVMDASGTRHRGTQVIVPADAPHRIDAGADHGAALYLDPETVAGAAADRRAHESGWAPAQHPLPVDLARAALADQVAAIIGELRRNSVPAGGARHPAVTEALRVLPTLVPDRSIRGADVARRVGLSPARLSHLFAAQVGIPLRPYILWLRLRVAIIRVHAGDDLAAAAAAAGFDDTAHLTRTCRRTFGFFPAALNRAAQWDLGDGAWQQVAQSANGG